jgi:hypothetical protein
MKKHCSIKGDSVLFNDIVWGVQHDAFENDLGRSLLRAWSVGACNEPITKMIRDQVRPLQMREAFGQLMPFRKPRLREGELGFGRDTDGYEIRVPVQWLTSGLLIAANTGAGKSNLLSFLALQIAASGCHVWLSEMYKTQLRHLVPLFHRLGLNLIILRPRDWKFNLLQAGPCDPRSYLAMAVDLLVRVLDLPPRARSILRQACHNLYCKFSIWDGRADAWPCLFDLYEWVRATAGLNVPAREAILDRLGALLTALTPECAAYRLAWNPTDLAKAKHSMIFEMRGAPEFVKQIMLQTTLFSVLQREVEHGVVNGPIDLFVAFEDSQRFFDASHQASRGEIAPMDELAGVVRGSAKGLGVIVQTMQGLSRRLVPNLATKILGRLGSHEDYQSLGADLAMNLPQLEWARRNLKPGTFVAQVADGNWREPFVMRVPLIRIPPTVDDQDAANSVKALESLPTVPALEFAHWEPDHLKIVSKTKAQTQSPESRLSEAELRFLKAVVDQPGKPSSFYSKFSGMSGKRAVEIRRRLTESGYLREHRVATGRRGRMSIILEPLEPAVEALRHFGK